MIKIQYPIVLVIEFRVGNDQNLVKQSNEEQVLLQANQLVVHLAW